MPRLHLKKTPAEEDKDARRKERKSRKHRKQQDLYSDYAEMDDSRRRKRHRRSRSISPMKESARHHSRRYYNQPPSPGDPGPSSYARGKDYEVNDEAARAHAEDESFEEKMRDALEDDGLYDPTQRLDGIEARLNSYAHIPRRWRGTDEGFSAGLWMEDAREDIGLEPWQMNDDEYSEYIRAGMWRKKNQAEYEERLRRKEERQRRQERAAKLREETRRLEREAQAQCDERAKVKARRWLEKSKQLYEERWTALLTRPADDEVSHTPLSFEDIPWPVVPPRKGPLARDVENITRESVSSFLLRPADEERKLASSLSKDILRTTMLRFHPDKFEARVLTRVSERDRELVKDSANLVVRILNDLLKEIRE